MNELTAALVSDGIDAFAGWEPVPPTAIAETKNLQKKSEFLSTDSIYWTGDFAEQHPETVEFAA